MRYQAEITALNILDRASVTVNLQDRHEEDGEVYVTRQTLVFHCEDADESNPRKWLRDVLMYVCEGL